jgi:hypothetical protein
MVPHHSTDCCESPGFPTVVAWPACSTLNIELIFLIISILVLSGDYTYLVDILSNGMLSERTPNTLIPMDTNELNAVLEEAGLSLSMMVRSPILARDQQLIVGFRQFKQ